MKRTTVVILLGIVALFVGFLIGFLGFHRSTPETPSFPASPTPGEESSPVLQQSSEKNDTRPAPQVRKTSADQSTMHSEATKSSQKELNAENDRKNEQSWDFSREDIAAAVGRTVNVEIGHYRIRVGETVGIEVTLDAPPLQAVVIAMKYDRDLLEPVMGSARAVGPVFRKGVEFFAQPSKGRMALFCATYPGKKNVLPAHNEVVATFVMKAKAQGTARVVADEHGMKCVAGDGTVLPVDFSDGVIDIQPAR